MRPDPRHGERGVALITALLSTLILLLLGLALLSVVDVQTTESANERTRDRGFNLSEGVLTSQAFVLGRNWPEQAGEGATVCSAEGAGVTDTVGATGPTPSAVERIRTNINSTYAGDPAYEGATWQVNICDDDDGSTVWSQSLLNNANHDANDNDKVWVRAQAIVAGKQRVVVGLVRVRQTSALNSRYALTAGGLTNDLGASINALAPGVLNGVAGDLLGIKPLVEEDRSTPTPPDPPLPPNGKTGLRCGATDLSLAGGIGTCVAGTIASVESGLPIAKKLVADGSLENLPGDTATTPENIGRLRAQAQRTGVYIEDPITGAASATGPTPPPRCLDPDVTSDPSKIVFIEKVGTTGTPGTAGGPGDQFCSLNVAALRRYKAIIVASGRIVLRGNGNATNVETDPEVNIFKGVVYALNQQRLPIGEGGEGLGDDVTLAKPSREIVRLDGGAHVQGGVNADGKSGTVGIYPPIKINTDTLVDALIPCALPFLGCPVRALLKALTGGVSAIVDGILGQGANPLRVVDAILDQARPQRVSYGSAITADVKAIEAVTVYGASGVLPGTFKDLAGR